ncbi:hypothetical protein [Vulcanisaeta sp. JCM 14467]|nr:hypothetical protein [Vulcanisaeta sp. JCM 14467]
MRTYLPVHRHYLGVGFNNVWRLHEEDEPLTVNFLRMFYASIILLIRR